jgi:hypothetical protein
LAGLSERHAVYGEHALEPLELGDLATQGKHGNPQKNSVRLHTMQDLDGTIITTLYLGLRGAERMARIYDRRGMPRFEQELRGEMAARCFEQIVIGPASDEEVPVLCMGLVRDFVEFRERRGSSGKKPRMLRWWAAFVGATPALRLPAPSEKAGAGGEESWLQNSVAKTLALVSHNASTTRVWRSLPFCQSREKR